MFRSFVQRVAGVVLCCCALAASADPPQHVGRVVFVDGDVVLVPAAGEDEVASPINYPLAAGALLRTRGASGAELEFAGLRLWLAGDSQLAVLQTEAAESATAEAGADHQPALQFALAAGALVARLDDPPPRIAPRLESAGGLIELKSAGEYRLDSTGTAATVYVRKGLLRIDAGGALTYLTDGQRVELVDGVLGVAEQGAAAPDDFDAWVAARQVPAEPAPRYVSSEMPGWRDLNTYGTWEQSADYGPVWAPNWVPAGWAPYRNGDWVWLPPWGWTWVDHAPWGFAPFHFGRWAHHHGRWCWVPGSVGVRPVFAPGLVHFFDGDKHGVHKHGGHKHPRHHKPHRWAPLTPHDKFVPTFPASGRFADRVNAGHGRWLGRGGALARTEQATPTMPVTARGGEMKVREWQGGRAWRNRDGGTRPLPRQVALPYRPAAPAAAPRPTVITAPAATPPTEASAGSALPAVGAAPAFAPVLGPAIAPALGPGRRAADMSGRQFGSNSGSSSGSSSGGNSGSNFGSNSGSGSDRMSGRFSAPEVGRGAGRDIGGEIGGNSGREIGRDLPRRSGRDVVGRRGGFVPPPVPSVPVVVVPAPAATLPVMPARRDEGGRSDWRERAAGQRHWPVVPAPGVNARPAGVAIPLPATVAPPQRWRPSGAPPAPAVAGNPPAATSTGEPSSRRFGDRDGGRGGWASPRGGGRRF